MIKEKFSVVIPCYNSEKSIEEVIDALKKEFEVIGLKEYEIVLVNDCSPDDGKTIAKLIELSEKHREVIVVDLAKNAGQHNATMVGLRHASGDYIISMDDDLQADPTQIKVLYQELLEKDLDIVYGYYPKKKHSFIRNIFSKINSESVRVLIGKPKDLKTSSFWIIKKFVRDNVIQYTGSFVYIQGLFIRTTNHIGCVPVNHKERKYGESNYTLKKLFKLYSSILGFTIKPLRLSIYIGVFSSLVSFLVIIGLVISKLINPSIQMGWSSLMCSIFLMSGLLLISLGVVGEYIGRLYLSENKEPQAVVRMVYAQKDKGNGEEKE